MYYGKIRSMFDDRGIAIKEAPPAIPVEIVGLSGVPMAGDELAVLTTEKDAKQVSEHRLQKQRAKELARTSRLSLEKLYEKLMEGEVKDLNLIIKADVQGSIEALKDSLTKLSISEVKISVIHAAVGSIRESDISLAAVSNAIILGFNVRPTAKVALLAEEENVDIRYYDIIYNAIKEIKDAMVGMMDAKFEEKVMGAAEVRETFHVPGIGTIAGSYVTSGKVKRGAQMRLIRDGIVTFNGKIATLRRFKDDVKEVAQNYECGIHVENYNDIKIGDVIECYYMEEVKAAMPE
jgi:translation initiation factor IF-2